MARRSDSRRRCRSNCSRPARFCSTARGPVPKACASPRRSASCSTLSMRSSPRSATSRSCAARRPSASLLRHIRAAMRVGALDLDHLSLEILTTSRPTLPPDHQLAIDALEREAAKLGEIDADQSAVDALGAAARRLILALGHIRRLEKALSDDKAAETAIGGVNLAAFLPKRSYSLAALRPAFHPGLAGAALFRAARAGDDGGSGHRAIPRRFRARQLGPADDLGHHARELRADQAAARRAGHRHPDRLRPRRRRGRMAAGGRSGRRAGCLARHNTQFRSAQLCARLGGRLGDRAGVAASRPARRCPPRFWRASPTPCSARRSPISSVMSGRTGSSPRRRASPRACWRVWRPSPTLR